jgi:thiamine-monophosphate kinase
MSGSDDNVSDPNSVPTSVPGEFSIIENLFAPLAGEGAFALQDDAALFTPTPGQQLVLTKDAIAEGRHYLAGDPPGDVARKLLRVNLSDLAAKGATPRGYLLSCAWSETTSYEWMAAFAAGLAADQKQFGVELLGGDTIKAAGPSVFSLTAIGDVAAGKMVLRSGARPGDDLWVTGTIGDGALGLLAARGELDFLSASDKDYLVQRYRVPEPPVSFGKELSGLASAALDVSDGLLGDLGHLCRSSEVGAKIRQESIPVSSATNACVVTRPDRWAPILSGGDDYQILFAAPVAKREAISSTAVSTGTTVTRIGELTVDAKIAVLDAAGKPVDVSSTGFTHF